MPIRSFLSSVPVRPVRTAALEAARLGVSVVLVEEDPVSATTMGDDIPLHYGQRFAAPARNRTAMLEAYVANVPVLTNRSKPVSMCG